MPVVPLAFPVPISHGWESLVWPYGPRQGIEPQMPWRVRASGLHYIRCHTNFRHPFKLYVDGKTAIEIDKFNYVAKFGDTDILSSVRGDLGLN